MIKPDAGQAEWRTGGEMVLEGKGAHQNSSLPLSRLQGKRD